MSKLVMYQIGTALVLVHLQLRCFLLVSVVLRLVVCCQPRRVQAALAAAALAAAVVEAAAEVGGSISAGMLLMLKYSYD